LKKVHIGQKILNIFRRNEMKKGELKVDTQSGATRRWNKGLTDSSAGPALLDHRNSIPFQHKPVLQSSSRQFSRRLGKTEWNLPSRPVPRKSWQLRPALMARRENSHCPVLKQQKIFKS
jgi:hypothetical protein